MENSAPIKCIGVGTPASMHILKPGALDCYCGLYGMQRAAEQAEIDQKKDERPSKLS